MTAKYVFKVIIMGEDSTGKSALLKRYTEDQFIETYNPTIGIDFKAKEVELDGQAIQAQIWDTSGQERLQDISNKIHYRGWDGAMIVFDLTNRSTFKQVENWLTDLEHLNGTSLPKVLVGNKCDLTAKRCVKNAEAKSLAVINNMDYVETSAKTDTDVESAFETLLEEICRKTKKTPEVVDEQMAPKNTRQTAKNKAKTEESQKTEDIPPWAEGIFKELQKVNTRMDKVDKKLDETVKSMSKRMDELELKMSKLGKK